MIGRRRRRLRSRWIIVAICVVPLLWMADKSSAVTSDQTSAVTSDQVDAAINRAKAFLYGQQHNGTWEKHPGQPTKAEIDASGHTASGGQWGGETALAVYALLAAGEPTTEPRLVKPIDFLRNADIKGTYALGLRAQLYGFLPPTKQTRLEAEADVTRLASAMFAKGPAIGLFDYLLQSQRTSRFDHSVSQYAVLGMWACERSGAEVPTAFWKTVQDAWLRDQADDGSWSYGKNGDERRPPTASMEVAGLATLFITQDYVHQSNGINCTGNVSNPHIDLGMKWIGDHSDRVFSETGSYAPYYALFGVQRVGVASGRKYLGAVNWYQRGADFLVKNQSSRGSWGSTINTCFALLFLSRGRAPVIINKLQYESGGKEGEWNQRPRDIANLTRWISRQTERDLNWQIVSLKGPVEDLLDAPVLYISGSKPLQFTAGDQAKLREYCEDGGLILGNPDCGSSAFTESFRKLGAKLFHDYEFRNLPAGHVIYTREQYPRSGWKPAPSLLGLSNGVRELMLLTNNSDPARHWQTEESGRNLPDYQLADDVVLYAIDKKHLLNKGETFAVQLDSSVHNTRTIKLARLQFSGNWNPEPGGWRRLVAILNNRSHIKLDLSVVMLGTNQLGDGNTGAKVATLTGTGPIKLNAVERLEIRNFLTGGGTLIVDSAGGDSDFANTVEGELAQIIGADFLTQLKTRLPESAPVYNLPGGTIKEFSLRPFARTALGSIHGPMLAAITLNNRPAIYYSRIDISGGLVGQPTDGITGYDPAVATAIMTNLVISAGLGDKASVSPAN